MFGSLFLLVANSLLVLPSGDPLVCVGDLISCVAPLISGSFVQELAKHLYLCEDIHISEAVANMPKVTRAQRLPLEGAVAQRLREFMNIENSFHHFVVPLPRGGRLFISPIITQIGRGSNPSAEICIITKYSN